MKHTRSDELFQRASELMPGGVNSPVRAFKAVGGAPVFIADGKGCRIHDVDGNEYIDFVGSWGPLILGHAHPQIIGAITEAAARGTTFGAPTYAEVELASLIREAIPSMQMLRLVSSGTEAAMSALRVARGFTGRANVIKFEGCYHGHHDTLLTSAGSGVATFDLPDSAGVPRNFSQHTISVPFNQFEAIRNLPPEVINETAAVIIEPVPANMGVIHPHPEFLKQLRDFTRERKILLIFDEVITGFRLCYGGVQKIYGIEPDLTILGKIVGGGMPLAAYGGRREIMNQIAPIGPVYQAGTLSGNPVAAAAGIAALKVLRESDPYSQLEELTGVLLGPVHDAIQKLKLPVSIAQIGSMFTIFFRKENPSSFQQAKECDTKKYAQFFRHLLDHGIYTACSQFEANFVGMAHTKQDIQTASAQFANALQAVSEKG